MATCHSSSRLFLFSFFVFCCCPVSSAPQDELGFDASSIFGGVPCGLVKCIQGTCVNTSSAPFYECQCKSGWKSPFNAPYLPCVLPNCSLDLSCSNTNGSSPTTPSPVSGSSNICSLGVCGEDGECTANTAGSNSSDDYNCKCNEGYINLFNKTDGFCIRRCSLGADCQTLNLPIGGGSSPAPPPAPNSNQGTSSRPSSSSQTSGNGSNKGIVPGYVSEACVQYPASKRVIAWGLFFCRAGITLNYNQSPLCKL